MDVWILWAILITGAKVEAGRYPTLVDCLGAAAEQVEYWHKHKPPLHEMECEQVARSGNKLTRFTMPDGNPVWIDAQWVTLVRHALPGEPGHTRIVMGGTTQNVRETPEEAVLLLQPETKREW